MGLKPDRLTSISYHPMKQPTYLFALHIRLLSIGVRDNQRKIHTLQNEATMMTTSGFVAFDVPDVRDCNSLPCDVDDGAVWACVKAYDVFSLNSERLNDSILHQGRVFGLADSRRALSVFLRKHGVRRRLKLSPLSYQRVSPAGLEHVLITRDRTMNYLMFRSSQKFDPIHFREIPFRRRKTMT